MKKKISVVYSVDFETEIEVDTELEEGCYDVEDILSGRFTHKGIQHEDLILHEVEKLLENDLQAIDIPENFREYKENSFTIKSIQV